MLPRSRAMILASRGRSFDEAVSLLLLLLVVVVVVAGLTAAAPGGWAISLVRLRLTCDGLPIIQDFQD
jgi:flagellar biosynthesis protein FlhB